MSGKLRQKEPVSHSLFYMWRCIIAIAHADGVLHAEEKVYLERIFAAMDRRHGLTREQKAAFAQDLQSPGNIRDMMRQINDPAVRSQLIYFGGLAARAKGFLHPDEEAILKSLHVEIMDNLDMEQIRRDVEKAVNDDMFMHDLQISALRPQGTITAMLDGLLFRLGIDILA